MKLITLILFLISNISFGQSSKIFQNGEIFWGAFDAEKAEMIGGFEKYADIIELKKIDNDYYVYAKDKDGKFRQKFSYINSEYFDEQGLKYIINEEDNILYILCLKKLPDMQNKFMMMKIVINNQ